MWTGLLAGAIVGALLSELTDQLHRRAQNDYDPLPRKALR